MKSIVKESWNLNKQKTTNTKAKTKCHAIHKNAFIISNPFLAYQEQKGDIHLECRMRRNYKAKAFNTPPLCIRPFYKRNIKCRTHSDAESSFLQTHIQWKVCFLRAQPFFAHPQYRHLAFSSGVDHPRAKNFNQLTTDKSLYKALMKGNSWLQLGFRKRVQMPGWWRKRSYSLAHHRSRHR